jgi:uncharacterized membrane protein YqjE
MPQRDAKMQVAHDDPRSVGDLFKELTHGMQTLVKNEVKLAKIELKESAIAAKSGTILLAIAVAPAVIGLVALAIGLTYLAALVMPVWAAALVVAAGSLGLAGVLALAAKAKFGKVDLTPDRTIEQIAETKQWLKHPISL